MTKDVDPEFLQDGRADEVAEKIALYAEELCPAGQIYPVVVLKKAQTIIKSRPVGFYFDMSLSAGPQPRSK